MPWSLFVINDLAKPLRIDDDPFGYFLNCSLTPVGDRKVLSVEGCLSLRTKDGNLRRFQVERYHTVRVVGKRMVGIEFVDFDQALGVSEDGIAFQHEIDHSSGKTILDLGKEILLW